MMTDNPFDFRRFMLNSKLEDTPELQTPNRHMRLAGREFYANFPKPKSLFLKRVEKFNKKVLMIIFWY